MCVWGGVVSIIEFSIQWKLANTKSLGAQNSGLVKCIWLRVCECVCV